MKPELARVLERQRQLREALDDRARQRVSDSTTRTFATTGALVPGDRVFDPATGEEGIIEHGIRENIIVPATKR